MDGFLLATIFDSRLWWSVPLIVVVSLVYAATRHELIEPILRHAIHTAVWIVCFMLAVFVVLFFISWLAL